MPWQQRTQLNSTEKVSKKVGTKKSPKKKSPKKFLSEMPITGGNGQDGVAGKNGGRGRAVHGPVIVTVTETANRTANRTANDVRKNVLLILIPRGSFANGGVPEDE